MTDMFSAQNIQKDKEVKSKILQQLYQGFQKEMKQLEEEQQKILLDMIKLKKTHE
jgi:hypothetical protein